MATHSSVLAWRIPGTGEPGGLPSMGLHRVRHDWSDLAAAATGCSRVAQNETPGLPPMGSGQWNVACRMLVPQPGIEPSPPAVEAQNLNHWTARKVLEKGLLSPSPNMTRLWPLIWLAYAYICLCLRVRNRHRQMLTEKKRTSFNRKAMGTKRPFGLSLFQMSKLRQGGQEVLASSHSQPAPEPGPELRGPASLDTNCKSGFQKPPLGWVICCKESQNSLQDVILTATVYFWERTEIKINQKSRHRGKSMGGLPVQSFYCPQNVWYSWCWYLCTEYAWSVVNQGNSIKLQCPEVLLGLHSISMSHWFIVHGTELIFRPHPTPWRSDWYHLAWVTSLA